MSLTDQTEKHLVTVQRLATHLLKTQVYPSMREAYLAARRILLESEEIKTLAQLNHITKAINAAIEEASAPAWEAVNAELEQYAIYEAEYYAGLIGNGAEPPEPDDVRKFINTAFMTLQSGDRVNSGLWGDYVQANINGAMQTVDSTVRAGYSRGDTIRQTVSALKTVTEGLLRNQAEALVRTGVQHYATQARRAMAEANKDVITREVPLVTFDNRTSLTCIGHSARYGQRGWPVGESPIGYPPYHFSCRTTIVYLTKDQKTLEGLRTATGGAKGEGAKEAYGRARDRTDGKVRYKGRKDLDKFDVSQIKASTQIDTWMRRQPRWFVESTLGKTRAELFLRGKLSLRKFTDATGEPLTLDELRALDAEAFRRAGL